MHYEPDTLWGRTALGDRELAVPTRGLSLMQRRVLTMLATPRPFATLAALHRLEVPRLEHELIALAEMQLAAFQRPGTARPRTAPQILIPTAMLRTAAIAQRPALPVYFFAFALGVAVVLLVIA